MTDSYIRFRAWSCPYRATTDIPMVINVIYGPMGRRTPSIRGTWPVCRSRDLMNHSPPPRPPSTVILQNTTLYLTRYGPHDWINRVIRPFDRSVGRFKSVRRDIPPYQPSRDFVVFPSLDLRFDCNYLPVHALNNLNANSSPAIALVMTKYRYAIFVILFSSSFFSRVSNKKKWIHFISSVPIFILNFLPPVFELNILSFLGFVFTICV